jgi:hypothetical protein
MYHVELRQFPHNFCHFNLTEEELRGAVLDSWARGEWLEFGERKWNPNQAQLTVLEGPRLALDQLSMGRGWRAAVREGRDVTEQMLEVTRAETEASREAGRAGAGVAASGQVPASGQMPVREAPSSGLDPAVATLVGELVALLGEDPISLLRAWQLALERHPDRTPSESLALAEDLLRG